MPKLAPITSKPNYSTIVSQVFNQRRGMILAQLRLQPKTAEQLARICGLKVLERDTVNRNLLAAVDRWMATAIASGSLPGVQFNGTKYFLERSNDN
jgi:hypothetical protein